MQTLQRREIDIQQSYDPDNRRNDRMMAGQNNAGGGMQGKSV